MEALKSLRPALNSSLQSARAWFHGMTSSKQRLHYTFHPDTNRHEDRSCPIRDVGTAADLAALQRHLGGREFEPVIASTLEHYRGMLVRSRPAGAPPRCHLAAGKGGLGEPSGVAHSSMLLLALAAWGPEQRQLMAELAEGIMSRQRGDGSFHIYFEPAGLPDSGWQLYGGEAAYALATAYGPLGDSRLLHAASRALEAYREAYRRGRVDPDELVFFANWQLQAAAAVHRHSGDAWERRRMAAYLHELQDNVIESGFFAEVAAAPRRQATVEVACALEGLAHCLEASMAQAAEDASSGAGGSAGQEPEQEARRLELYAECARIAAEFLLEAQVKAGEGVPQGSVGGFGHTQRAGAGQRVDVTGHAACAFIKLLELLEQA